MVIVLIDGGAQLPRRANDYASALHFRQYLTLILAGFYGAHAAVHAPIEFC